MRYKKIAVTDGDSLVVFELNDGLFCIINGNGEHQFKTNWLFLTKWVVLDLTADAPADTIRNAKAAIENIPEDDEDYRSLKSMIEDNEEIKREMEEIAKEQNDILREAKAGKIRYFGDI